MLHPQARALLDLIAARGLPPTHTLAPPEARAMYLERRFASQPPPRELRQVDNFLAPGPHGPIPLRLYHPFVPDAPSLLPVLVYFHGGGWVIGDLDTHDTLCRELADRSGCVVIAVDYRLAPEHRFPAAVDDAVAATRWIRDQGSALGIDAMRLAVGGDSAGGNLAAVVAIAARDRGDLSISYQLLIYPATDMHRSMPSHAENGAGYLLTRETMDYFVHNYIPDRTLHDDWRASPLLREDLTNLPPALVLTAGFDPLRDEGAAYAERLTRAGNHASYVLFPRQIHGFVTMGRVIDEAHAAVALCAAEVRRALWPTASAA